MILLYGTETNPSSLDVKIERLPKELSESVDTLGKDDDVLKDLIGEKLLQLYWVFTRQVHSDMLQMFSYKCCIIDKFKQKMLKMFYLFEEERSTTSYPLKPIIFVKLCI